MNFAQESSIARVAVCTLNQWAMDFEGNKKNILESLKIAQQNKCTLRVGPELEISGYGCEDHFLEMDTIYHSWQILGELIESEYSQGILCDFGMPLAHKNVLYNCRVMVLNKRILLIRPKIMLADNGNYREPRWFTSWQGKQDEVEEFTLPLFIQKITNQINVPIGNLVIQTADNVHIGYEICEEMWSPHAVSTQLALDGVEIIINPSGSHYERHKQKRRTDLIKQCTSKSGGIYLYSNVRGCDGGRVYYDGNSIVALNGVILAMSDMFSLKEVDVIVKEVDVGQVRQFRLGQKSYGLQSTRGKIFVRCQAEIFLCQVDVFERGNELSFLSESDYLLQDEQEISYGPSCYLWDYLNKSGANGYFLPLSGGADSASTALMVYNMCKLICKSILDQKDQSVLSHLKRILGLPLNSAYLPQDAKSLCSQILFTAYLGTENSSQETKSRAELLAQEIGCTHFKVDISEAVKSFEKIAEQSVEIKMKFQSEGGTSREDLCLQNVQARSRMVLSYLLASLIPQSKFSQKKQGFLLVLGSANLDEGLRGYMTKYDCSSADLNPIGSISKAEIKKFLIWNARQGIQSAQQIIDAKPTAELRPLNKENLTVAQNDEEDMGMTYEELRVYGTLRKNYAMGPYSMFKQLLREWPTITPQIVAEKTKKFFFFYSINRHKQTTITPSYHTESYSIDDNRFDLRPFLYNPLWTHQFKVIDLFVTKIQEQQK